MMKSGLWPILFLALLLLVSCRSNVPAGDRPTDTAAALRAVQTGTQGIEISTTPNYPPALLYDQNPLVAILEVKNKGNYDLEAQNCIIQVTGYDPNIIGGMQSTRSCADNTGALGGKNVYNLDGGYNQIEFSSSNLNLPQGVYEYSPTLNFMACYNYHTVASPSICVDPLLYQVTAEQRTCNPTDVILAGGQGGPVGVSYVGVDMVGKKGIFEINVRNFGSGRVLNPDTDISNCGESSLTYQDLDRVRYNIQLSGGNLIDCKPSDGIVRLSSNQGKIVCSFDIPGGSAFETPLLIDLDYGYVQSFTKAVKIIKTPQ